jgi:predicted dehydrogenase
MINFGVIGYGYWGPNIVRNLNNLDEGRVLAIADKDAYARNRALKANPGTCVTNDASELISDPNIDCIAIITPVWTHFELAKAALNSGKHVFVEKPFTSTCAQAARLIDLAATKNLVVMVDHTFLFTAAVQQIKHLVEDGVLGKLYYYDSMRVNLGLFQHDINVLWDLAPHDLAIIDHIIGDTPEEIVATGAEHLNDYEDVAFMTLYFPDNVIAHVNVNWLSPVKVRTTLIGGAKKMLVWNDLEADEKIKIYDKGARVQEAEGLYNLLVNYRSGDMWAPHLNQVEALQMELAYLVGCISKNETPINDGYAGLRIVKMLEAADQSLCKRGVAVHV